MSLRAGDAHRLRRIEQVTRDGVARITLARPIAAANRATRHQLSRPFQQSARRICSTSRSDGDWYAFTQFEPIDARAAFPGFDEPRFKTPFTLSIVAPKAATVAANTPIAEIVSLPDDTKRVPFEPTAPLPTYLVAFAVGPLDVADGGRLTDGSPLAAVARPRGARTRHGVRRIALANTPEIVALLDDYFAQPYPFAKLDLVAVPSQIGCDGERGADHVRRISRCCSATSRRSTSNAHSRRARARTRASVVRRLGDDAVVGRPVVERGVRDVHEQQDRRSSGGRVTARAKALVQSSLAYDGRRWAREREAYPRTDRRFQRHHQRIRRHHVLERRGRARTCSKASSAKRRFATACARISSVTPADRRT